MSKLKRLFHKMKKGFGKVAKGFKKAGAYIKKHKKLFIGIGLAIAAVGVSFVPGVGPALSKGVKMGADFLTKHMDKIKRIAP